MKKIFCLFFVLLFSGLSIANAEEQILGWWDLEETGLWANYRFFREDGIFMEYEVLGEVTRFKDYGEWYAEDGKYIIKYAANTTPKKPTKQIVEDDYLFQEWNSTVYADGIRTSKPEEILLPEENTSLQGWWHSDAVGAENIGLLYIDNDNIAHYYIAVLEYDENSKVIDYVLHKIDGTCQFVSKYDYYGTYHSLNDKACFWLISGNTLHLRSRLNLGDFKNTGDNVKAAYSEVSFRTFYKMQAPPPQIQTEIDKSYEGVWINTQSQYIGPPEYILVLPGDSAKRIKANYTYSFQWHPSVDRTYIYLQTDADETEYTYIFTDNVLTCAYQPWENHISADTYIKQICSISTEALYGFWKNETETITCRLTPNGQGFFIDTDHGLTQKIRWEFDERSGIVEISCGDAVFHAFVDKGKLIVESNSGGYSQLLRGH